MKPHQVVSQDEWAAARTDLLVREKAASKARETLTAARAAMPWMEVETEYVFDGPDGAVTLADLFDGRSQLIVSHFMFAPEWDAGCPSCSFWADGYDGQIAHLNQRDVSFAAISRAPIEKLQTYRERMGWSFSWVSSVGNTFNQDFGVAFAPDVRESGARTTTSARAVSRIRRAGVQRICARRTTHLPDLLMLLTRPRSAQPDVPFPRHGPERPRRSRPRLRQAWVKRRDEY